MKKLIIILSLLLFVLPLVSAAQSVEVTGTAAISSNAPSNAAGSLLGHRFVFNTQSVPINITQLNVSYNPGGPVGSKADICVLYNTDTGENISVVAANTVSGFCSFSANLSLLGNAYDNKVNFSVTITNMSGSFGTIRSGVGAQTYPYAGNLTNITDATAGFAGTNTRVAIEYINISYQNASIPSAYATVTARDFYTNGSLTNFSVIVSSNNESLNYNPFTNLSAWYALDDNASNSIIIDRSENNFSASYIGSSTNAVSRQGIINNSILFNSTYINTSISSNNLFTQGFTISAWVYPYDYGDSGAGRIVDKAAGTNAQNGFGFYVLSSNSRLRFNLNTTAINSEIGSIGLNNWQHAVIVIYSNGTGTFFVNGSVSGSQYQSVGSISSKLTTLNNLLIGERSGGTDRTFNGTIDDVRIYNYSLSASEVQQLYLAGAYRIYQYNTTNGSIQLNILSSDLKAYNLTLNSTENGGYFQQTYLNYVFNTSGSIAARLSQSAISFIGLRKSADTIISGVNFTTSYLTNVTHYMRAGVYTVTAFVSGFLNQSQSVTVTPLQITTVYITNMTDAKLNVTAVNNITSTLVTPLNVIITSLDYGDTWNETFSSLSYISNLTSGNYTITAYATGFTSETRNVTIVGNLFVNNVTFTLYPGNSVLFSIYNATSFNLISGQTSTIQLYGPSYYINTTTNGTMFLSNLTAGMYNVTISASGFQSSNYVITVGESSFQYLNAYLESTTLNSVIFTIYDDETSVVLPSAQINIEKQVNGTYYLVNAVYTDISGRIEMTYETGARYRFTVSKSQYITKQFELNPIIFSSYDVRLQRGTSDELNVAFAGVSFRVSPGQYFNNMTNNVSITLADPEGRITQFNYTLVVSTNNATYTNSSNNVFGATLTSVVPIANASNGDRVYLYYQYTNNEGSTYVFSRIYTIEVGPVNGRFSGISNNQFGLALLDRVIILTIITLVVGGMAFLLGGIPTGGFMTIGTLAYFAAVGMVSWWLVIPACVLTFLLIAWSLKQ